MYKCFPSLKGNPACTLWGDGNCSGERGCTTAYFLLAATRSGNIISHVNLLLHRNDITSWKFECSYVSKGKKTQTFSRFNLCLFVRGGFSVYCESNVCTASALSLIASFITSRLIHKVLFCMLFLRIFSRTPQ